MSNSNKISRAPVLWQALVAALPIKFDLTPTSPELFRAVARIGAIVFATGFWGMGAFAGWDLTIRHAAIFSGFASLLSLFCTAMILFWVIKPSEKAIQGALLSAENRSERLANALARLELQKKVLDFHAVVSECDATGRITYVNDAFCRVSGYAPGDLIGKPYSMFNAEGLVKTDWDEMYRKVTSGGVWQQEVCNKRKDGSDFWLLQTVIGAMNAGGELTSYVNVGTDLSESKALRQEMLRKDKLAQLGELTATVAHEIRNPLGAVKTAAFVLERKVNSYVQQQTRLQALAETGGNVVGAPGSTLDVANQFQRISTGISRCDRIIAELLDFARKKAVNAKEHSIDLWVREVVDEETRGLPSSVRVLYDLQLSDVIAAFDADQMRRVLINLVSNASEAMVGKNGEKPKTTTSNPEIRVKTRRTGKTIEITVTDNGPGITPDDFKRIREPLFTTKSFGIGLGIPAVEKILENHGGGLEIKSEFGHGASMTAWFPYETLQQRAA